MQIKDESERKFPSIKPWIQHYHFRNISSADYLHVFELRNVYAAARSRIGMVPLFEGIVNYDEITQKVSDTDRFASLEWFGKNSKKILKEEMKVLTSRNLEVVTS